MLTLWSVLCRRCPLLPSYLSYCCPRWCIAGVIKCADRGREINRLPLQLLAHPGINGKLSCWSRVVWRRVTLRNDWRSCLTKAGDTVGYRMRAQNCVGPNTRPEVVTEGVLTRMIQRDPELSGVGLVILDEFHERSLQADLALALLLDVQQGLRDDLKLLIMSATLDNDRLQQMLPEAPVVIRRALVSS